MQTYRPSNPVLEQIDPDYFVAQDEIQLDRLMSEAEEEKMYQGYEVSSRRKIGRNEKCPCGSKKKFKKCCISKARR